MQNSCIVNGVSSCVGCGLELAIRHVMKILGQNTVIVIPPGCAALFSGFGIDTAMTIPGFQGNLENTASYAAGIRAGLERQGKTDVNVLAFAGDGATVDIGLQALSGVFERNERIIYVCYDNEAYMNTGGQRSSSTPYSAVTTTTPNGKNTPKKDMFAIANAHNVKYIASVSIGNIPDLERKVAKAKLVDGTSYIHIHTPCPTGWGFNPSMTVSIARQAIESGIWELFEIVDSQKNMTYIPKEKQSEEKYWNMQKRFYESKIL